MTDGLLAAGLVSRPLHTHVVGTSFGGTLCDIAWLE